MDDVLFLRLDAGHRDATSLRRFGQPYIKFFILFCMDCYSSVKTLAKNKGKWDNPLDKRISSLRNAFHE